MKNTLENSIKTLSCEIADYAGKKALSHTVKALDFISSKVKSSDPAKKETSPLMQELEHCLEVCTMLIELHLGLSVKEEDTLLSAVLLHIYPEMYNIENLEQKLVEGQGFSREIYELTDLISQKKLNLARDHKEYYESVEKNKLALLAALADRGNVVQKLYKYSSWNAHRYIDETKICYYPMCIYGKEHYHELLGAISILKEKIKSLVEMQEILLQRYEVREAELIQDTLALREENATIRGIIASFKAERM